jgi:hypothetical protein
MFKKASKEDVDKFMSKAILNDNIYPYLSTNKYFGTFEVPDDDWSSLLITNDSNTFIFKVTLRRAFADIFSAEFETQNLING